MKNGVESGYAPTRSDIEFSFQLQLERVAGNPVVFGNILVTGMFKIFMMALRTSSHETKFEAW